MIDEQRVEPFSLRTKDQLPAMMTLRQVCVWLNVSRQALWQWRNSGILNSQKMPNGGVRFKREDVIALFEGVKKDGNTE